MTDPGVLVTFSGMYASSAVLPAASLHVQVEGPDSTMLLGLTRADRPMQLPHAAATGCGIGVASLHHLKAAVAA